MSKNGKDQPPAHLHPTEAALWRDLVENYSITDSAGRALLLTALEALQRGRQAREAVDELGMLDAMGKVNPLLAVERDCRRGFLSALDKLGLDLEPAGAHGRPTTATTVVRRIK